MPAIILPMTDSTPWVYNTPQAAALPPLGAMAEFYTMYSPEAHIGRLLPAPEHGPGAVHWAVDFPPQPKFQGFRHSQAVRLWRLVQAPAEHLAYLAEQAAQQTRALASCDRAFTEG